MRKLLVCVALPHCGMDSFTLFGHIVHYVGSNMSSLAHVELQSLGVRTHSILGNGLRIQYEFKDGRWQEQSIKRQWTT